MQKGLIDVVNEQAKLIYYTEIGKDDDGFPTKTKVEIPIYVRDKSATRSEFYEALRAGVQVKNVFETRQEDYDLSAHEADDGKTVYATQIEYEGGTYDIVRAYRKNKSTIELTCQ